MCFFYIQKKEGATMSEDLQEEISCLNKFAEKVCIGCKTDCEHKAYRSGSNSLSRYDSSTMS